MMWRSRAEKERAVMWCLHRAPDGLYALELCKVTGIGQGAIDGILSRLQNAHVVAQVRDAGPEPQRSKYFATQVYGGCLRHIGARHPGCSVCYPMLTVPQLNAQYQRIIVRDGVD